MLSGEQVLVIYERGLAVPDRLTRKRHAHYVEYARRLMHLYSHGIGRTRQELHRGVRQLFLNEPECPPQRVAAFCKLLDEKAEYDSDTGSQAAALRLRVFERAAAYHPLVERAEGIFEHAEQEVKARIAGELGMSWSEIEQKLYCDVLECQPLVSFQGYASPADLLARYNVAQVQGCLYRATDAELMLTGEYKRILRQVRLLRLLHEISRVGDGYRVRLSGPASVLGSTRRYGVDLAKLFPVLAACSGWYLKATVQTPWGRPAMLKASHEDGLQSHLPPTQAFDSEVERAFADKWGEEPREGWRLFREATILCEGQAVFFPDFVFRHEDGREAYLEVVGFWTEAYLAKKRETLRRFRAHRVLLAVCEACLREGAAIPEGVITYKTVIKPEAVLAMLGDQVPPRKS